MSRPPRNPTAYGSHCKNLRVKEISVLVLALSPTSYVASAGYKIILNSTTI